MDNNHNNNNNNKNKHQKIVVVVALIAAASLLSLGAVAATTVTPAYAGGDDDDDDNGRVKQIAKSETDCEQENEADGDENTQTNSRTGGPEVCVSAAINVNKLIVSGGGSLFAASTSEASPEEFSAPSTP
jgi:hypothetical protein